MKAARRLAASGEYGIDAERRLRSKRRRTERGAGAGAAETGGGGYNHNSDDSDSESESEARQLEWGRGSLPEVLAGSRQVAVGGGRGCSVSREPKTTYVDN